LNSGLTVTNGGIAVTIPDTPYTTIEFNSGFYLKTPTDNCSCLYFGASVSGNYSYIQSVLSPIATNNLILNSRGGNVGIGTSTPSYKLDVNGSAYINGTCSAVSFNATSDYRIKENVLNLRNDYLNKSNFTVDNLRPVTYTNKLSGKQDMGFIAHELQEHYPFLVSGEKDGAENQSVNYTGLIALLVKEIQELKQDIKLLKNI